MVVHKTNGVTDVELQKDELENIVQSVNYMTDKVKKELLENLPSSEEGRKRLDDDYAALKEGLKKILEELASPTYICPNRPTYDLSPRHS